MEKEIIYLDNNATTPIDPIVLEAMMPFLTHNFANAASTHQFGVEAYEAVKRARKQVAEHSESLIMGLSNPENDEPMTIISNEYACTAASIDPSHVLFAIGLDEVAAFSSISFSIGKFNSQEQIEIIIDAVENVVIDLRAMVN